MVGWTRSILRVKETGKRAEVETTIGRLECVEGDETN